MGIFGNLRETRAANKAKAEAGKALIHPHLNKAEKLANNGAIHLAALELRDGEQVLFASCGKFEEAPACLTMTDTRVIITSQKGTTTGKAVLDYDTIDRVDCSMGMLGAGVTFYHGSQRTTFENSSHGPLDKLRDLVAEHRTTAAPAAAAAPVDGVEQVAKLAELHAAGVLTDEEFAAAKAKALGL